nr:tRNA (5-methylaminomethyl-2-thiouridylate)-methyltransferase [Fusobacterium sp.]
LLKETRFFRLDKGRYLLVGRNQDSNMKIQEFKDKAKFYLKSANIAGPHILSNVELEEKEKEFAKKLFSRYSKLKGKEKITVNVCGEIQEVEKVDLEEFEKEIKLYQQV